MFQWTFEIFLQRSEHVAASRARIRDLETLELRLQPFLKSDEEKPTRMSLKRQVNKAVTTIAQSKAKINASAQDLIRYSRVAVGLPEPQGEFVAHCIAERFAEQGEVQIKIKKDFAWPVAMVFSPVGQHWGLVRELFDATMFRRCPFLIPEYVKSKDYASRDAFLAASGREPGEEELAYCSLLS